MLTQADHATLASYTTLPVLTPEQAHFIHKCMPANSWLDRASIRWWYPISDTGFGVPEGVRYDHPISKALTPRPANPNSIEQRQPWLDLGMSRARWYQHKAEAPHLAALLSPLPDWVDKAEGLKLYKAFACYARAHKLDIKGLWAGVCSVLNKPSS
jgi:hypothetical protein